MDKLLENVMEIKFCFCKQEEKRSIEGMLLKELSLINQISQKNVWFAIIGISKICLIFKLLICLK